MILRSTAPALLLALAVLARGAEAQQLDGEWFRAVVSAKGHSYEPFATGATAPAKVKKIVNYVQVVAVRIEGGGAPSPFTYDLLVWRQDAGGQWVQTTDGSLITSDPDEDLVLNGQLLLVAPQPAAEGAAQDSLGLFFNGRLKSKTKNGALAAAKIVPSSVFCSGTLAGGAAFVGKPKLKLVRVPPGKLPFEP